jgi:hypothetical protein
VALGAFFHVTGFGRPAAIQASAVAPFGIQLDPIRRVRYHQKRFVVGKQRCDSFGIGGIAAQHAVLDAAIVTEPQISRPRYWILRKRRNFVGLLVVRAGEQIIQFFGIKPKNIEIVIGVLQLDYFNRRRLRDDGNCRRTC